MSDLPDRVITGADAIAMAEDMFVSDPDVDVLDTDPVEVDDGFWVHARIFVDKDAPDLHLITPATNEDSTP